MKNKTGWKYTIRKLGFLLVLAALVASPFAVQTYNSLTTIDPYILMAREVESFSEGAVDVLLVQDDGRPEIRDGVIVVLSIDDYFRWSERIVENFNRHVMNAVRPYEYERVLIAIGWGAPADSTLIQREVTCTNIRVSRPDMCSTISVPGMRLPPNLIKWPGIGKP